MRQVKLPLQAAVIVAVFKGCYSLRVLQHRWQRRKGKGITFI